MNMNSLASTLTSVLYGSAQSPPESITALEKANANSSTDSPVMINHENTSLNGFSELDRRMNHNLAKLLNTCEKLRFLLHQTHSHEEGNRMNNKSHIKLPSIVVIGQQSAAKSSVVEALCGIPLPCGSEITTRTPMILHMIQNSSLQAPKVSISTMRSGEDNSSPHVWETTNLTLLSNKIREIQNQIAGSGASISSQPIHLTIARPVGVELTVVDLVGLTRNPIKDQPRDIYKQIKQLILEWIKPKEHIIVNVLPATIDFTTCECLQMAKEVDPQGIRTLAVVTKPDLCEPQMLKHKLEMLVTQMKISLGVIAVLNRTQNEIDTGMTLKQAFDKETLYWQKHPAGFRSWMYMDLSTMQQQKNIIGQTQVPQPKQNTGPIWVGMSALAHRLAQCQFHQLMTVLPSVKTQVEEQLYAYRQEFLQLNMHHGGMSPVTPIVNTESDAWNRIDDRLNFLTTTLYHMYEGDYVGVTSSSSAVTIEDDLFLGAKLRLLFRDYSKACRALLSNPFTKQYVEQIQQDLDLKNGFTLPNMSNVPVFKRIMSQELKKIQAPSKEIIEKIYKTIDQIVQDLIKTNVTAIYPKLGSLLAIKYKQVLSAKFQIVQENLIQHIKQEQCIMNTLNPMYESIRHTIGPLLHQLSQFPIKEHQHDEKSVIAVNKLNELLNQYGLPIIFDKHNGFVSSTPFQQDLQISCFVYSHIMIRRFIDFIMMDTLSTLLIPLTTHSHDSVMVHIRQQLRSCVVNNGMNTSANSVIDLVQEHSDVAQNRVRIGQNISDLEQALVTLETSYITQDNM